MSVTAGRIDYRKFDYQLGIGFGRALIAKLASESWVIGLLEVLKYSFSSLPEYGAWM